MTFRRLLLVVGVALLALGLAPGAISASLSGTLNSGSTFTGLGNLVTGYTLTSSATTGSGLFGTVAGWNLFILLTYVGAGGLTALWLRALGLPLPAALVGGLAFTLAPYRVAQSTGHLLGPISMLIPLALYGVERCLGDLRDRHIESVEILFAFTGLLREHCKHPHILAFGQVVGQFEKVEKTAGVIERWVQEYLEATNTLNELNAAASV